MNRSWVSARSSVVPAMFCAAAEVTLETVVMDYPFWLKLRPRLLADGQRSIHQRFCRVDDFDVGLIGARCGDHVDRFRNDIDIGFDHIAVFIGHGMPWVVFHTVRRIAFHHLADTHTPNSLNLALGLNGLHLEYD